METVKQICSNKLEYPLLSLRPVPTQAPRRRKWKGFLHLLKFLVMIKYLQLSGPSDTLQDKWGWKINLYSALHAVEHKLRVVN